MKFVTLSRIGACALFGAAAISTSAAARPQYESAVPNANCASCHVNPAGGGARNAFGQDIEGNMPFSGPNDETWAIVFCADSDGDGVTNGAELGDPCGTWKSGDADPDFAQTNPGDADDTTDDVGECDGEAPEVCEVEAGGGGCNAGAGAPASAFALMLGLVALGRRRRSAATTTT
jgi:uncharacterized protein (TIGR03382 family)